MADMPLAAAVLDSLGPLHKFLGSSSWPPEVLALQPFDEEQQGSSSNAAPMCGEACVLLVSRLADESAVSMHVEAVQWI